MSSKDAYSIPVRVNYRSNHPIEVPFHSHAEYEIYYFQGGKCNYLIGDKIHVMQPGDLIIMHGMTLHRPNIDYNYPYIRSMIHFDPSFIQGLFNYPQCLNVLKPFQELGNYRIHLSLEHQQEIEHLFTLLDGYQNQQNKVSFNRLIVTLMDFMVFLYGICEKTMIEQTSFPSEKVSHVQNIISYIEKNYMRDFHLSHIEEYLHLNKFYLSKIFKEVTGTTIFTYLLQRRINQAKILFLMEKYKSVTEVGYQVGFKHPAHFSRVFKQQVNCTAEQYRKNVSGDTNES
jgi:AraC-like DNA-binding protein